MQRITYVNTSVLAGDSFGDTLLDYAAALARNGLSERLKFQGIGAGGDEETISFIVGPASEIVVESVRSELDYAPDNPDVVAYMQRRIGELTDPRPAPVQYTGQLTDDLGID
jgi:hypothetical protein